jgi:hypothetical protein
MANSSSEVDVKVIWNANVGAAEFQLALSLEKLGAAGMAKTLYILDDGVTRNLGQTIIDAMKKELAVIFSFDSSFKIAMTAVDKIPALIDFSDSIVKIVATDDHVNVMKNQAMGQQNRSLEVQIQQRRLPIRLADFKRSPAAPERGGVGWHGKEVLASAALCQTGGIASMETVIDTVLTQFAPNRWTLDEAKRKADANKRKAASAHPTQQKKMEEDADAALQKSVAHWKLQAAAPKTWPANLQDATGIVLARLVAHEARHQYIEGHFEDGGLGGESAELYGVASSETFLPDDRKLIAARLATLTRLQGTATVRLELFPRGQPFAFREGE